MAAQAPPAQVTVATPQLQNLTTNQVVDNTYNRSKALLRALKVFVMSYPVVLDENCSELYRQKFLEYLFEMQVLYGIQIQNFMPHLEAQVKSESLKFTVAIIKFRGRDVVTGPRIVISIATTKSQPINLDTNNEIQKDVQFLSKLSFDNYRRFRIQIIPLTIRLEADQWHRSEEELREFQIRCREIHSTGFEDWFDFGRGVQLLIKIGFGVNKEKNITDEEVSKFHFHTILYAIRKRIQTLRANKAIVGSQHPGVRRQCKISYIKKKIDMNSDEAFWSTPNTSNTSQTISSLTIDPIEGIRGLRHQIIQQTVEFNDLQIGYEFFTEFEDSVCLCSEWCNWNAFFYHNPIYRFLLVRHNQLYLKNRTNIPDMYLFASVFFADMATTNLQPTQLIPKTPLIQLMFCANDYKLRYSAMYSSKQVFKTEYSSAYPTYPSLNGLSYNLLRYNPRITEICLQSNYNPFADICVENVINYYKVLSDLHSFLPSIAWFIPNDVDTRKEWFDEFDQLISEKYKIHIKFSYDKMISNQYVINDHLFTQDYDYLKISAKTEGQIEVKSIRDKVYDRLGSTANPFNIKVICSPFITLFISIHELIQKSEPNITSAETTKSLLNIIECCKTLDTDFNNYANTTNLNNSFTINNQMLIERELENFGKYFYVLYTLKLYSIGYGIQRKCIKSVVMYVRKMSYTSYQVCDSFTFVWRTEAIESKFRALYPNETLYQIDPQIGQNVIDFYDNYWGKARHELQADPTIPKAVSSALFQYKRLYFWSRNNGNNRLKFMRIFETFDNSFPDIINRSETLYIAYILSTTGILRPKSDYYLEIMDVLVYYLVKANCYIVLSTVATLLKPIHSQQIKHLAQSRVLYSLTKPGWVHIFKTMRKAIECVNSLKPYYIIFDDEFNRISNTFSETKHMIKEIYGIFYKKLFKEWYKELEYVYALMTAQTAFARFINLHLIVGLSVLAPFRNEFREYYNRYRVLYQRIMALVPNPNYTQQMRYKACENVCLQYLSDEDSVQMAQPFECNLWRNHFQLFFAQLDQLNEQQTGINLGLADI